MIVDRRWVKRNLGFDPIERPALPNIKAWYQTLSQRPGFQQHILGPIA